MSFQIYGVFVFAAFCAASFVFMRLAREANRSWNDIFLVLSIVVPSSLLGAKIGHTLFEAAGHPYEDGGVTQTISDLFEVDPWHWARIFAPGYVFYGGLIAALLSGCIFLSIRKTPRPWQLADHAAIALALGLCIGRIGCFFAGCCFGKVLPGLGIQIPVPLIESCFALLCFLYLLRKRYESADGQLILSFLLTYGIFRFFIEYLRGDADRGIWFGGLLSTSQIISLFLILLMMALKGGRVIRDYA